MLGLAVGIDYALFILSRYRQNTSDGLEPREAAAQATGTAGSAVVFAGMTVVIALARADGDEHPVPDGDGTRRGGRGDRRGPDRDHAAAGAARHVGKRVSRGNRVLTWRLRGSHEERGREQASVRYARFVTRRPLAVVFASLAVLLLVVAVPATHMKLGLPDGGSKPADNTERKAYDLLSEGFGPGFNGVLTVVVDAPDATKEQQAKLAHDITGTLRGSRTSPRSRRHRRTRRAT